MPINAYRDENDVPTLIAVSNVDGQTVVRLWADPVTHRLLVDSNGGGGSSGFQQPTSGVIDGVNKTFTWTSAPNAIVVDQGRTMQKTNSAPDSNNNWSGTTTTVLQVAPSYDIFAVA